MTKKPDGGAACNKTLRDEFAMVALQGMLAGPMAAALEKVASRRLIDVDELASKAAYEYADAMLKEREK
jgi:hypothetical protein